MARPLSFLSILGLAPLFVGALSLAACSGAPGEDNGSTDSTSDELSTKECGGFVAHPKHCKAGYTCIANRGNPDLPGTCEKNLCVIDCAQGEHFVQDDQGCRCEPDATKTCADTVCWIGSHCEMKGTNGNAAPVCISNATNGPTCMTLTCESGYHCEEKGINGGVIATCIAD
jgi:hypothetical protein